MELLAIVFGIALMSENAQTDKELAQANAEIVQLKSDFRNLAGSHASVSARDKTNYEAQQDQIDALIRRVMAEQ